MELIFKIVSFHRLSPEQKSEISVTNTLTFGRSENNDWHLPDPEKVVSGLHARIEKLADGFYIYDLSTNGLYINRAVEALGQSSCHKLSQGDLLTFGDYEVSVTLTNAPAQHTDPVSEPTDFYEPALNHNHVQGIPANNIFGDSPVHSIKPQNMPLVSNDLNDHFDVPQAIPQEWNSAAKAVNSTSVPIPEIVETPVAVSTSKVPAAGPLSNRIKSPFAVEHSQQSQIPPSHNNISFDSFIKGLGLSQSITPDHFSDELLYEMGQGMQQLLMGLVTSLRTRTALKNKFKINQTTFQQQENNPLKFSATMDDVFQNLFLRRSSSFLPANKAITEAFNDTQKHDIALSAGTLGAIKGVFDQLAPCEIEKKDLKDSVFDQVIPGQKQSRYWKIYQSLHKDMVEEINVQGSSVLSDDFVKAYDKKIQSL